MSRVACESIQEECRDNLSILKNIHHQAFNPKR
jgi:hypothetical protein